MLIVEPCDTTEKIVLLREQVETMLEDLVDVSNSVGYLLSKFTTFFTQVRHPSGNHSGLSSMSLLQLSNQSPPAPSPVSIPQHAVPNDIGRPAISVMSRSPKPMSLLPSIMVSQSPRVLRVQLQSGIKYPPPTRPPRALLAVPSLKR